MFVKADADVVFPHELFKDVDVADGLGGDGIEAEFFRELEHLPPFGFVAGLRSHDAITHRADMVFGELVFDLLNDLVRNFVVPANGLFGAQFLTGIKLDGLAAGLGGALDRIKNREMIERVGLTARNEIAHLAIIRNRRRESRSRGDQKQWDQCANFECRGGLHDFLKTDSRRRRAMNGL